MRVFAYVYPGWHPTAERDRSFYPGFTEWDLVETCRPRFAGHVQPWLPLEGRYDDRDPSQVARRIAASRSFGVDGFVYGFFWCRGKRVFQGALDDGFLGSVVGRSTPFAIMWANRMPRRVLPVKRTDHVVIDERRRVPTDVEDFVRFVRYVAERYFVRDNYLRVEGKAYLSIFDSTFFLRELGPVYAARAIEQAREMLQCEGLPPLHLAAIDPSAEVVEGLAEIGFDSVTHYVLLPEWKGEFLQDYGQQTVRCSELWATYASRSRLPYFPSVATGWDASARGADFGPDRPDRYPWWPVVTNRHPSNLRSALRRALRFARAAHSPSRQLVFLASANEWSEGHHLEPDTRFGYGWLDAVRRARLDDEQLAQSENLNAPSAK